jgi:hypothetical protein
MPLTVTEQTEIDGLVNALYQYFSDPATTQKAISSTSEFIKSIKAEYEDPNKSYLEQAYVAWKSHHIPKMHDLIDRLSYILKAYDIVSGGNALLQLLEFLKLSDSWYAPSEYKGLFTSVQATTLMLKGSINYRLTEHLLQCTGLDQKLIAEYLRLLNQPVLRERFVTALTARVRNKAQAVSPNVYVDPATLTHRILLSLQVSPLVILRGSDAGLRNEADKIKSTLGRHSQVDANTPTLLLKLLQS